MGAANTNKYARIDVTLPPFIDVQPMEQIKDIKSLNGIIITLSITLKYHYFIVCFLPEALARDNVASKNI